MHICTSVEKIMFYYISHNLLTIKYIVVSEGNNFDCLMAMSPSHAQCRPVALYVYAQIAYYSVFGRIVYIVIFILIYKFKLIQFTICSVL